MDKQQKTHEQGFHQISNEEYHADKSALSNSAMKHLLKSPAHYKAWTEAETKHTAALNFGSAFHPAILEPDKYAGEVVIAPDQDKRTKAGKAAWAEFEKASEGKIIISQDESETIKRMKDAVYSHPEASTIIGYEDGVAELSAFWKDERGFMCKIRPDWLPGHGLVVDLKSTEDASNYEFARSCANFGYHRQAYFYLKGLNALTDEIHDTFVFIAVEKKPPYGVAVYYASPEMIALGQNSVERALDTYAECLSSDSWPCYPETAIELNLPRWAA